MEMSRREIHIERGGVRARETALVGEGDRVGERKRQRDRDRQRDRKTDRQRVARATAASTQICIQPDPPSTAVPRYITYITC
jgi:hypothetical protein